MTEILNILPNVLLIGSLVGLGVFAFTYSKFADWRSTKPGRALMYMIVSMASVLVMAFAHLITGPYHGIEFVRLAVYGALTGSIWRLVFVLYRELNIDPLNKFRFWNALFKRKVHK